MGSSLHPARDPRDQAVEAAALAILTFNEAGSDIFPHDRREARAAVDAAAPFLAEAERERIADLIHAQGNSYASSGNRFLAADRWSLAGAIRQGTPVPSPHPTERAER